MARILLIDEPELHLDPQWHRQVLKALKFLKPECQIIVATHSAEICDSVMSFERHFLAPDDDPRVKIWEKVSIFMTVREKPSMAARDFTVIAPTA